MQDYLAFTDRNPITNRTGLRVLEWENGTEPNEGILDIGRRKLAYSVIAYDEHNQPVVRGQIMPSFFSTLSIP